MMDLSSSTVASGRIWRVPSSLPRLSPAPLLTSAYRRLWIIPCIWVMFKRDVSERILASLRLPKCLRLSIHLTNRALHAEHSIVDLIECVVRQVIFRPGSHDFLPQNLRLQLADVL
eukprot:GEMP01106523.1.p2 GENE.GEMP01106523.1~~GEMP01106523.1.p2  ORF type:complete len:116 (-),score=18.92 GEMP01106523.1:84-431(-)